MKKIYFFCLLAATQLAIAQIKFENAYLIDQTGNKKDVLIRNGDWLENPVIIQVKDSEASKEYSLGLNEVQEFGFQDDTVFRRFTVDISNYDKDLGKIDQNPDFSPQKQTVFLKQLSDGKLNLYSYYKGTPKYFYAAPGEQPKQLLYRRYYNDKNDLQTVNTYREQLASLLNCSGTNYNTAQYSTTSLKQLFDKYNNDCNKVESSGTRKSRFAVNVVAEAHMLKTSFNSPIYYLDNISMESQLVPKFGIELEYFLPFNKQSFSIIAAPKYYQYKNEFVRVYDVAPHTQTIQLSTSTLEIPLGFRYYNYFNNSNSMFATLAYQIKTDFEGSLGVNSQERELQSGSATSFLLGVGYRYKRLMGELVYAPFRSSSTTYFTDIKTSDVGLSLKYNIF